MVLVCGMSTQDIHHVVDRSTLKNLPFLLRLRLFFTRPQIVFDPRNGRFGIAKPMGEVLVYMREIE
jgi:hypothetical protein